MDKENLLQISHNHINGYIKSADQKASILLTAQLAFLALSANLIADRWTDFDFGIRLPIYLMCFTGITGLMLSGWVVFPREECSARKGVIYWGHVNNFDSSQSFLSHVKKLNNESVEELCSEIYEVSRIAHKKHNYLRISIIVTMLMVNFGLIASLSATGIPQFFGWLPVPILIIFLGYIVNRDNS